MMEHYEEHDEEYYGDQQTMAQLDSNEEILEDLSIELERLYNQFYRKRCLLERRIEDAKALANHLERNSEISGEGNIGKVGSTMTPSKMSQFLIDF
jgi:hypothetical protein